MKAVGGGFERWQGSVRVSLPLPSKVSVGIFKEKINTMKRDRRITGGFTLIELLIVVAIIAILAAIAIPNFLEAQVRSKVARTRADMRSLATAIESYRIDGNQYLPDAETLANVWQIPTPSWTHISIWARLTTPVAYMSSIPHDVFPLKQNIFTNDDKYFLYNNWDGPGSRAYFEGVTLVPPMNYEGGVFSNEGVRSCWCMYTCGPDLVQDGVNWRPISSAYDPSNGTASAGDIGRWGP